MKELKFRAWLKEFNKMVDVSQIDFDEKDIMFDLIEFDDGSVINNASFEDIELMQCICLKDKNGKEIYEGDIVKIWKDKGEDDIYLVPTEIVKVINFGDGCFRFGSKEFSTYNCFGKGFEIIGNIYENGDLLEEK